MASMPNFAGRPLPPARGRPPARSRRRGAVMCAMPVSCSSGICPATAAEHVGQRDEAEEVAIFVDHERDVHRGLAEHLQQPQHRNVLGHVSRLAQIALDLDPCRRSDCRHQILLLHDAERPADIAAAHDHEPRIRAIRDFPRDIVLDRRRGRSSRRPAAASSPTPPRLSASASTPWIISFSTSSITPASVPSAIAILTSSSVTLSRALVADAQKHEHQRGCVFEQPDQRPRDQHDDLQRARHPRRDPFRMDSAMRLGTSSPTITDKTVMPMTTTDDRDLVSASGR